MKKNAISSGIALILGLSPFTLYAQEANDVTNAEGAAEVEVIQVTGSRIKRTDLEGVAPVVTLTAEDIVAQGHSNVFDALNSLAQNTGQFIGEEVSNNFNGNAQTINLRGFGPGYTLTLLNGKRIPVLPKPAGGLSGNVVNLAMIPTEAVKRIEILSGGASAIYGSDAVAGVVNIILKDDLDYTKASMRFGDTKDGGGQSKKFTLSTGGEYEKLSYTAVVEIDKRDPIYGDDRDWFDEPTDGPDETRHANDQVMSFWDRSNGWALNNLSDRCDAVGYEADRAGWATNFGDHPDPKYCTDNTYGTKTIRNERNNISAFINLDYETDDGRIFATLLGTKGEADSGLYRYSYAADYVVTDENNNFLSTNQIYRQFQNSEVPTSNQSYDESTYMGIFGIEGVIADELDYSVTFTASQYDYEDSVVRFDDQKMLGLLFGEKGVDWQQPWDGSRWVTVDSSQVDDRSLPNGDLDFFGELSPEMFNDVIHKSTGTGDSYLYSVAFDLTGSLLDLPAGDLQFAFIAEYMKEGYEFVTDEKTINGEIYGWGGIGGGGDRDRYATGLELAIPITDSDSSVGSLEGTVAGRYDYYDDDSEVGGAFTYQLGLSWRPIEQILVRGNYATSFRAPEMNFLYADESSSFDSSTDYTTCVQEEGLTGSQSWDECSDDYGTGSVRQYSKGDISLEEETGDSLTLGIVANIIDDWSVSVDYYELSLEKKVSNIGMNTLLTYEAECTVGYDQYGNSVDTNSAKCQEMLGRVSRGGPNGGITSTITSPFNTGLREQKGIDASSNYTYEFDAFGSIFFNVNYTHILETNERFLAEDDIESIRDNQDNNEFRTRTTATLGWFYEGFTISAFADRLGSAPVRWSDDENERYSAWTRINLNTSYEVIDGLTLTATVVNLFDEQPPQHESEKWWPFADISKYNAVGMEYFVTASYVFQS